jgi:hypothetical protein
MQLGAPKEEVVGDLARVLLAAGEQRRVIDLVGDVGQWPQNRRLELALSKPKPHWRCPAQIRVSSRRASRTYSDCVRLHRPTGR